MRLLFSVAFCATLAADPSYAATVLVDTFASSRLVGPAVIHSDTNGGETADFPFYFANSSIAQSTYLQSNDASARAYANGDRGELRVRTGVRGNSGDGASEASAQASATITETFTLNGSGLFTASMLVDGWWQLFGPTGVSQLQASINAGFGSALFSPSVSRTTGSEGGYLLSVSGFANAVLSPKTVTVTWNLFAQQLSENGLINFSNTGKVFVETSESLVATASDPDFLSDPAFLDPIAPVPLPAGLPLFGFAIASLAFVKRRGVPQQRVAKSCSCEPKDPLW